MPELSIVIPVYNVEEYLPACMDSVLGQNFTDYELILVDDGSTDSCPAVCDRYAGSDARIKVIHKENGGLSSARNEGTKAAAGEFIFYLDSDDCLEPGALEEMFAVRDGENADVVIGSFCYAYPGRIEPAVFPYPQACTFSGAEAVRELAEGKLQTFAWGKLIRAEIAKRHAFPEGKVFEDHYWTHWILHEASVVAVVPFPVVRYRQRDDSISYTINMSRLDMLDGWTSRKAFLEEHYPELVPVFLRTISFTFTTLCWLVLRQMPESKPEAFKKLARFADENRLEDYAAERNKGLIRALEKNWRYYALKAYVNRLLRRGIG